MASEKVKNQVKKLLGIIKIPIDGDRGYAIWSLHLYNLSCIWHAVVIIIFESKFIYNRD